MTDHDQTDDLFTTPGSAQPLAAATAVPDPTPAREGSIGSRLRVAREAKHWSVFDCAQRLHLPVKVLQRLEADDFGAPEDFVFLRGALTGYARFLDLPPGSCDEALRALAPQAPPALVSVARTSRTRWLLQRYGTAATYIVLTATIAVPLVWLGLRGGLQRPVARIVSLDQPVASTPMQSASTGIPPAAPATASPDATPYRAAMTPFAEMGFSDLNTATAPLTVGDNTSPLAAPATTTPIPTDQHALTIDASADCWFEITDAEGTRVASGMLHAGDRRTWHAAGLLHVTLGNADGVSVTRDGQPFPLDGLQHGNVARFNVFGPSAASDND